ncbi:hypothetical protein K466DRAFT_568891 [Polyporus arcularius HHB13444]|uniref:Uncharacterized protein n=1 Tax=Polyporus arcularius HHB13444 TaxID=1314778 RepID=A0A5C3P796_9APHY|nr:hypothetical protein K466DRAFT_568891 [Polyporus arcularius HHB13444]
MTLSSTPINQTESEDTQPAPEHTDPDPAPETPRKRLRFSLPYDSPKGPKTIHINTDDYVARPNDIVTDTWVSPDTTSYLYKFINYYNPEGTRFPIHHVPKNLHWTVVDEDPRFMQVTHLERPLLIWILGTLVDASLVTTRAFPTPRVRVVMDFLREHDREAAIALYNQAASTTVSRMETLIALAPTNDNEGPPSYDQIYDARERFEDKSNLKHITQAKLFSGDIVLAECTLVVAEQSKTRLDEDDGSDSDSDEDTSRTTELAEDKAASALQPMSRHNPTHDGVMSINPEPQPIDRPRQMLQEHAHSTDGGGHGWTRRLPSQAWTSTSSTDLHSARRA